MPSPLSDVGLSIKRLEIQRALEDVRNMEARLNKQLVDDGREALEPFLYTREQMAEVRAEIAALKQPANEPRKYFWGNSERMSPVAAASPGEAYGREREQASKPDDSTFVDMTCAALADRRIRGRRLRQALSLLAMIYRPSGEWGGHVEVSPARAAAISQWITAMVSMPIPPKDDPDDARPVGKTSSPPTSTPDELTIERAAALASGIASGEVVRLPVGEAVKFIRDSYAAAQRPRGEEKPR